MTGKRFIFLIRSCFLNISPDTKNGKNANALWNEKSWSIGIKPETIASMQLMTIRFRLLMFLNICHNDNLQ